MYVDESGDIGIQGSKSTSFILSAVILHESHWLEIFEKYLKFRRVLKVRYNLPVRKELHTNHFINKPKDFKNIPLPNRISIIKEIAVWIRDTENINCFSVCINKSNYLSKDEVFEKAWIYLIQRYENTIINNNFSGSINNLDFGLIITDKTDGARLRRILRKMRKHNLIPNNTNFQSNPNRNIKLHKIIEDPYATDSKDNYFIQLCDLISYLICQKIHPNKRCKKFGLHRLYDKTIIQRAIKQVSRYSDDGIVYY